MGVEYDLSGKRVLVVGASSGVGREVGLAASRAGARVAFSARRLDALEAAAAKAPGEALALAGDATSQEDCARVVARMQRAFGGLDAVVYAAGMSPLVMLERARTEQWRTVFDVNVIGASNVTAAALPALRESRGRSVYISSYSIRMPMPGLALYRVSKVALDGLIESWRMEHPDLDFTRVVVGNTSGTQFANGWDGAELERIMKVWVERNIFPANTMMPLDVLAEAVLSVLAVRGYVDDLAVMPRTRDPGARPPPEGGN